MQRGCAAAPGPEYRNPISAVRCGGLLTGQFGVLLCCLLRWNSVEVGFLFLFGVEGRRPNLVTRRAHLLSIALTLTRSAMR